MVYLFKKASEYLVDEPSPSPPLAEGEAEEKKKEEEEEEKKKEEGEGEEEKKEEAPVDAAIVVKEEISTTITAVTVDREVVKISEERSESIAIIHDKEEAGHSSNAETAAIETSEIGNGTDTIPPPPPPTEEEKNLEDSEKKESIIIEDPEKKEAKVDAESLPSAH